MSQIPFPPSMAGSLGNILLTRICVLERDGGRKLGMMEKEHVGMKQKDFSKMSNLSKFTVPLIKYLN